MTTSADADRRLTEATGDEALHEPAGRRAPTTTSTSTSDSQIGRSWRWLKSQKMNAITMPKAPWAMLKTRVVV